MRVFENTWQTKELGKLVDDMDVDLDTPSFDTPQDTFNRFVIDHLYCLSLRVDRLEREMSDQQNQVDIAIQSLNDAVTTARQDLTNANAQIAAMNAANQVNQQAIQALQDKLNSGGQDTQKEMDAITHATNVLRELHNNVSQVQSAQPVVGSPPATPVPATGTPQPISGTDTTGTPAGVATQAPTDTTPTPTPQAPGSTQQQMTTSPSAPAPSNAAPGVVDGSATPPAAPGTGTTDVTQAPDTTTMPAVPPQPPQTTSAPATPPGEQPVSGTAENPSGSAVTPENAPA